MVNEIKVFQNSEFGELEVLNEEGKMYFPATACARKLGYEKPQNAISQHCRYSLKRGVPHPQNPSKTITMNFIPEGDLYRLIVHSRLPEAERFERWVFDEVLPEIRRQGAYIPDMTAVIAQAVQTAVSQTVQMLLPYLGSKVEVKVGREEGADKKFSRRRNACSIGRLDPLVRLDVEKMIMDENVSYKKISEWLWARHGKEIATSSICRYAKRMYDAMEDDE